MGRIHILPERVANRIAAGEVVERPASVVKELVENALDAGADSVELRIEESGRSLIEVSDDGSGMGADDARLAFERHATSKIVTAEEIDRIASFGFRGEALPSIASVAEVELITAGEDGAGTRITVRGGGGLRTESRGRTRGTTVRVRNIFYNTPARRKFLKSDQAEERQIRRAIVAHALARTGVAFRYVREGEEIFHLPAGEELLLRIARLFGKPFADGLVPVEGREHGPEVTGFTCKIEAVRGNRAYQYFSVNGRPVQQNLLVQAATTPYREALPPRRYPAFILSLVLDPEFVDVNIHPTKREVRFSPERTIFASVERAVRRALRSEESIDRFWHRDREGGGRPHSIPATGGGTPGEPLPLGRESAWTYHGDDRTAPPGAEPVAEGESWLDKVDLDQVQQVGNTFLVAAGNDGVLVADQHTVHERILFEEALARIEEHRGESQRLLFPESVDVGPELVSAADEFADLIEASGFLVRAAGPRSLLLEGTPPGLRKRNPVRLLVDFLDYLIHEGKAEKSKERRVAASIACHGAVRAGDSLSPEERKGLLLRLASCDQPLRCPHGRPTFLTITAGELEHRFLRT